MTQQAKAGDIGHGMDIRTGAQLGADIVQPGGTGDHFRVAGRGQGALFHGGGQKSGAQALAQDQHIAGPGADIALNIDDIHHADRRQAINGFQRIDGMAARDGYAGLLADGGTARHDPLDGVGGNLVDGHADDRQGQNRTSADRINIGERIGRRDAAEIERIIDHGHKEIRRRHHRTGLVNAIDGGVVTGIIADQQIGIRIGLGQGGKQLPQHGGGNLTASTAAVGQGGQPHRLTSRVVLVHPCLVHQCHCRNGGSDDTGSRDRTAITSF